MTMLMIFLGLRHLVKGIRTVGGIPTESLGTPWRQTSGMTQLSDSFWQKVLWTFISTALTTEVAIKSESYKWTSPCSCFHSGCAVSSVIWSHWLDQPQSQGPHLTSGDNESIWSISRIVSNEGDSGQKGIRRVHSTIYKHQNHQYCYCYCHFMIYKIFCFFQAFLLSSFLFS